MRLYTDKKGQWFGTQADARSACGELFWQVDVPTDKPALLAFLNHNAVSDNPEPIKLAVKPNTAPAPAPASTYSTGLHKPHPWQTIRECAETAPLKDWGVALAVLMNRVEEIADKESV